jgi:hypothetical protein
MIIGVTVNVRVPLPKKFFPMPVFSLQNSFVVIFVSLPGYPVPKLVFSLRNSIFIILVSLLPHVVPMLVPGAQKVLHLWDSPAHHASVPRL